MVVFDALERRVLLSTVGFTAVADANLAGPASSVAVMSSAATVTASNLAAVRPGRVSVFSWSQPRDPSSFDQFVYLSLFRDPTAEAERAAPLLKARQPGNRVVFPRWAMHFAFERFDPANPASFVASGPDLAYDRTWHQTFFARLKALDAPLDRVVLECEQGFTVWHLFPRVEAGPARVAIMQSIYSNPDAFAKLPPEVRAYLPQDYSIHNTTRGRAAYIAWNTWAISVFRQAVRDAVIEPLWQVYGPAVKVSNYTDISPRTELMDRSGFPLAGPETFIPGNVSSPECYLTTGYVYSSFQKDWRWNRLIDILNMVRAGQNVPNVTVVPWISYPSYAGDSLPNADSTWLWEQMLRHMAAGGVDSFLYWNPSESTPRSDDQMADWLFQRLRIGTPTEQSLQPIAFDADVIVTQNVRTTYAEFLTYVDLPLAKRLEGVGQFIGPVLPPVQAISNPALGSQRAVTTAVVPNGSTLASFCGPTAADKFQFAVTIDPVGLSTGNITFSSEQNLTTVQPTTSGHTFAPPRQPMATFAAASSQSDDTLLRLIDQLLQADSGGLRELTV